jgi:hypothetical protein
MQKEMCMSSNVPPVTIFTPVESVVLNAWFARTDTQPVRDRAEPPPGSDVDRALVELGYVETPGDLYTRSDAAVGGILLEAMEHRLPQWMGRNRDGEVAMARKYSDPAKHAERTVKLTAQSLLTINWGGGPGNSWPESYKLVWVPVFERFVVTSSSDSPEGFGYCDFALGAFTLDTSPLDGARNLIAQNWATQRSWEQERWESVFTHGLVSMELAHQWADVIWPKLVDEDDVNDS